jgi:hypothetical protein
MLRKTRNFAGNGRTRMCFTQATARNLVTVERMTMARTIGILALLAFAAIPLARAQNAPVYKVDPFWPKPLPNKWSMQQIVDIYVDKDDHIWVLNRRSDARPMSWAQPPRRRAVNAASSDRKSWSSIQTETC